MFTAAKDVESAIEDEKQPTEDNDEHSVWEFTDRALMQEKRDAILSALERHHDVKLIRRSNALYSSADHAFRTVCTVSKRYVRSGAAPYWYAYHTRWDDFLGDAAKAFFTLGCMDLDIAFAIPLDVVRGRLDELNTTEKSDGRFYWHIKIIDQDSHQYALQMPKSGKHLSLSKYAFKILA